MVGGTKDIFPIGYFKDCLNEVSILEGIGNLRIGGLWYEGIYQSIDVKKPPIKEAYRNISLYYIYKGIFKKADKSGHLVVHPVQYRTLRGINLSSSLSWFYRSDRV